MWNWQNTPCIVACAFLMLASAPAHALLIVTKSTTSQVVVGSAGAETVTQSVVFNAADFSGAADDIIQKLTVEIDLIKCDGGPNYSMPIPLPKDCPDPTAPASVSNIGFSLTGPLGTVIDLVSPHFTYLDTDPGGRILVIFDDDLGADVVGFSSPSFMSGTFYTQGFQLSQPSIVNHHATGTTWNLAITNDGAGAPLGVASFAVKVSVNEKQGNGTTIPEPGTLVLLGLGLAGALAHRRRAVF
jgi:hypothetical protein